MATVSDVQAKMDTARKEVESAGATHAQMVTKYGSDWTKWPKTSHWYKFEIAHAAARAEVALLGPPIAASFTYKES